MDIKNLVFNSDILMGYLFNAFALITVTINLKAMIYPVIRTHKTKMSSKYIQNEKPFYRKRLESYLGSSFTREHYDSLLDEVAADVERRMKELVC